MAILLSMGNVQRVIVYGDSVALAGITASLALDPECEVIGHTMTVDRQELCMLQPDVVIYELDAVRPEFPYMLSRELPGLLLVGIDVETNRVFLWAGQQVKVLSSQGLAEIIHQATFLYPYRTTEAHIVPFDGGQS
jgi:hypothetical protein